MGCHLKRPELLSNPNFDTLVATTLFQWAATSNALCYKNDRVAIKRINFGFQWAAASYALSYIDIATGLPVTPNGFQCAATSYALSYRKVARTRTFTSGSFNGLTPQTPSALIGVARILDFYGLVSMGCDLKRPQHHVTRRAYKFLPWFQWAATSNALSIGERRDDEHCARQVSMGCHLKCPQHARYS